MLDGTRVIAADWKQGDRGIWTATVDFDVWQLFVGEKLVYLARWPDASFEDGSIWRMTQCTRNTDHGWDRKRNDPTGKTRPGLIYDASFEPQRAKASREGGAYRQAIDGKGTSLANCGKDFTGALAVLNCGHWVTWTRPVTQHAPGQDHFRYEEGASRPEMRKNVVYYMLGLAALDRPNEWFFDPATRTIYLMPPHGTDPNELEIRGKTRDHGLVLKDCADLVIHGLRLFGQGFLLDGCERVCFTDCRFDYPATHRFLLGDLAITTPGRTRGACAIARQGNQDIVLTNCRFEYSNMPLYLLGTRTLVENCYFHDIEWDVNSSGACGTIVLGRDAVFRRNTVARAGNSEGVRPHGPGCTIVLNHLYDMGNLQHDGAAINVGTRDHIGCLVARNWVHGCNRQGIRFDYHGENILREDGRIYGDGVYLRNVIWNTESSQVKGDRHLVLNNTVVNCNRYPNPAEELMNMGVMGFKALHGLNFNEHSLTRNNLANLAHRSWNFNPAAPINAYRLPGRVDHNMRERGAALKYLRDPANHDFRPVAGSPLVDAGKTVAAEEISSPVARLKRIEFVGRAPDIGAYEYGAKHYWIPGYKRATASTPVPRDRAVNVPTDCDLMFLEAYQTTRHKVYCGTSPDDLQLIAELEDDTTNVVAPHGLKPHRTYFWRVDATDAAGNTKASPLWSFTTSPDTP